MFWIDPKNLYPNMKIYEDNRAFLIYVHGPNTLTLLLAIPVLNLGNLFSKNN